MFNFNNIESLWLALGGFMTPGWVRKIAAVMLFYLLHFEELQHFNTYLKIFYIQLIYCNFAQKKIVDNKNKEFIMPLKSL